MDHVAHATIRAQIEAMKGIFAGVPRCQTDEDLTALVDVADHACAAIIETPAKSLDDVLAKLDLLADEVRDLRETGERADEREHVLLAAIRRDLVTLFATPQGVQKPA
jgi:hypothetical protein